MLAIQVITELKDMSLIQEKFSSLFSNFEVSTQARPDGGILLTLRGGEGREFKRSISYQQLHNGDQLSWTRSPSTLTSASGEVPTMTSSSIFK